MKRHLWLILALLVVMASMLFAGHEGSSKCTYGTQECLDHMAASMKSGGWVGVELETDNPEGYEIKKVIPGSPAESAGLQVGDILVALNGVAFKKENEEALKQARKEWKPGQVIQYTVKRDGAERQVSLTLASWPADIIAKSIGMHMLEHVNGDAMQQAAQGKK